MATYPTDFSKWETDMVRRAFGLNEVKKLQSLSEWMAFTPPALEANNLASVQWALEKFGNRARFVSESDIKMKLLGPALVASGFDNKDFSTFGEIMIRTILTATDGTQLKVSGRPDLVVAMGEIEASLPKHISCWSLHLDKFHWKKFLDFALKNLKLRLHYYVSLDNQLICGSKYQ